MAKLAFFATVLVALVALSASEGDNTMQLQCQRELQESSLDACRQVVNHQVAVQLPFLLPQSSQLSTGVRVQCCQQLQDISRECRAAAVRQIVRQYEHQAMVPLREEPYDPSEDDEEQGGSYYPGETYPQQEQGGYHPSQTSQQQQEQGRYHPRQTSQQQQEQGWYHPRQTSQQQQEQGWYHPRQTSQQQQEQGWYHPSQTSQQQQEQGWYRPSQTSQQQQEQGWYRPSQTSQQQQEQGYYRPSQTSRQQEQGYYRPSRTSQQQEQGYYRPSQTSHQQQEQGSYRPSQTFPQQQQQGQEPYRLRIIIYRQPAQHALGETVQQQEGQGQYCGRQSQTGFGGFSSPSRFGTQQQAARLRMQLQVVARARQVAAQLPVMCRLEGSAFSTSQY